MFESFVRSLFFKIAYNILIVDSIHVKLPIKGLIVKLNPHIIMGVVEKNPKPIKY